MKKVLGLLIVWSVILGGGAFAFLHFFPEQIPTPPESPKLRLALDSFSGYCVFRSPAFKKKLAEQQIDFEWIDDKADYSKRMETLKDGSTPLAVFTIDALINQTPRDGEPPAAIILIIDETRGADAMVSYPQKVRDINALNSAKAKLVFAENTPSETLARVVRSHFQLPNLPRLKKDFLIPAKDAEDVLKQFIATEPTELKAFVLWEPYVSKAISQGAHKLVDSSEFKGYIVDVLVVQQKFLHDNPEQVRAVVRAYLEVLNEALQRPNGMTELVLADSEIIQEKLTPLEAEQVARGIWWKNTVENYAHFGLLPEDRSKGLQLVGGKGGMIENITKVLQDTTQPGDPIPGMFRRDKLLDNSVLSTLYKQQPALHLDQQFIRDEVDTPELTANQWKTLQPVASFKVEPITFSSTRKDQLTDDAKEHLDALATRLKPWPQYYLRVEGHTLKEGDREANMELARKRAESVKRYLSEEMEPAERRLAPTRLQAIAAEPGQGREVRIVALRKP